MRFFSFLCLSALTTAPTHGATISSLFNTGVDSVGVALADGALDPHYVLVAPGALQGQPYVATSTGGFPIPPWLGDNATSAWTTTLDPITPVGPGSTGNSDIWVDFYYQTTFSLSGLIPATTVIVGQVSFDNYLQDILINGQSTGISANASNPGQSFLGWLPFSFDASDISLLNGGINTLTFIVRSGAEDGAEDLTGVRVEFLQRTADVIPEPAALSLLSVGLLALRRRR